MEVEAKYEVADLSALDELLGGGRLGSYRLSAPRVVQVRDTYLDTPSHLLWRQGYACRIRQIGDRYLLSVKSRGGTEGQVHRREEYETDMTGPLPPEEWPACPARDLVRRLTQEEPVETVASVNQDRTEREVRLRTRAVGVLSVDQVIYEGGGQHANSLELEVELGSDGTPDDLARLHSALAPAGLVPQSLSKLELAVKLLGIPWMEDVPMTQEEAPPVALSVEQLCARNAVDMAHANHVADLAVRLFDELPGVHGLPPDRRELLRTAAVLHNVGMASSPDKHHTVGRDIILGQEIQGVSVEDRDILACVTRFHRKRVRPAEERVFQGLSPEAQTVALALAALVRVADGLDYSQSQTTSIVSVRTDESAVRLVAAGPHEAEDAARAEVKADLWFTLWQQPLRAIPSADAATQDAPAQPAEPADEHDSEAAPVEPSSNGSHPAAQEPQEEEAKPTRRKSPGVEASDPMVLAGMKVLSFHFERLLGQEQGAADGEDIECVHDMRVATRRLRAALRLFGPYLPHKSATTLSGDLRQLARVLGGVRDLDVLLENARGYADSAGQAEGMGPLLDHWAALREDARKRLLKFLESPRYAKLKLDFAKLLKASLNSAEKHATRPSGGDQGMVPVYAVAPSVIWDRFQTVRAYEPRLVKPKLATLHLLRIDCKRLRYTLEFLRETLGDPGTEAIKTVTGAQDHLGALHDADVAVQLISELLDRAAKHRKASRDLDPGQAEAIGGYRDSRADEVRRLVEGFPEIWEGLSGQELRSLLGQATSLV
ncbi:MAG TPA: CHAD domain-containing protein [Armatimonadota bacterium]